MSPFSKSEKIYVCCPGGSVTGGPELLHQLVSRLGDIGRNASIVYYPLNGNWDTPEEYLKYNCQVETVIPDRQDVAIIVPETFTRILEDFNHAKRVIWWLSVDNYRGNFENFRFSVKWIKRAFVSGISRQQDIVHLFQSEYAKHFVKDYFGAKGWILQDYIADEFIENIASSKNFFKSDCVVYNPKKGGRITRKIIRRLAPLKVVPLIDMNRNEVRSALQAAKVYIDFGYHPGKDRIPREAAACGCVVIVARRGSAKNHQDVALGDCYKFVPLALNIKTICNFIAGVISAYDEHCQSQQDYRSSIHGEKAIFFDQVDRIFSK